LSPAGQTLVLADDKGHLTSLDSLTLKPLAQPSVLPAAFRSFAFRKSGDLAVIGGKTVRHWHLPLGQELVLPADAGSLPPDRAAVLAATTALSGSGNWAVTVQGKHLSSWSPFGAEEP